MGSEGMGTSTGHGPLEGAWGHHPEAFLPSGQPGEGACRSQQLAAALFTTPVGVSLVGQLGHPELRHGLVTGLLSFLWRGETAK